HCPDIDGRGRTRIDRVPDDLCRGDDVVRGHTAHERHQHPGAQAVPRGVRMSAQATARHPSAQRDPSRFEPRISRRHHVGSIAMVLFLAATLVGLVFLVILLVDIWPALVGSVWVLVLTAVVAFPLGVGTAIWLEEYAPNNRLTGIIEANIANLAGVPSIVYGILGLAVFVRALAMGRSVIAGALTLALLILPVVIIASQEAIRAVPNSMRLGSYALGATRWETIRHHVLPHAMPGILTGTILALSRAVG